jgi:ABC-type antimicrobial peptide transport system permease subunit
MEGYNLVQSAPTSTIVQGRDLNASDAGTNNIAINDLLTSSGPFSMHLKPGDTITFASADGKTTTTATVVGIYARASSDHAGNVLASQGTVHALAPARTGVATVTYMKIDPAQVNKALNTLGQIVPNATIQNLADIGTYITQMLNNILEMLIAIASLSLIAGVIIVANAVALAMLERRRELGILKSVGYTSGTILSQVLIENGITGSIGAFIATLLAAGGVTLGSKVFFQNNLALSMQPVVIVSMIAGPLLLAILTAVLVAWNAVRVRPLMVLRYE